MKRAIYLWLSVCLAGLAPAAQAGDPAPAAIDKLFAAWDKPDTPGAALAVVRDGKIAYSRGYGMANLEYGAANAPGTIFHAASLSKQFTAFAIHLLAQEGKLSLDDDVRKYLPELQVEANPPITIRHLIHHTSGLRDQWSLLMLAGLRLDDGITEGDILGLLFQQKQLNFKPGDDEVYSNSGYTLLGLIVRRVSGKTLAAFAQERIFTPLGMKSTRFQENYGELVKGRAYSYRPAGKGYRYVALSYSNTGATSLLTTVEDLALWNANYDDARVGGPAVQAAMLVPGRLNSGKATTYASGVVVAPYRGVQTQEHSGSDAGYRAFFMRVPQQRLAVLLLGNAQDFGAADIAHRIADLYLEGTPGLEPLTPPKEVEMQARDLAAYAGDYEVRPGGVLSFTIANNKLFVQQPGNQRNGLLAVGGNQFRAGPAVLTFAPTVGNEPSPTALLKSTDRDYPLKRIARETPTAEALQACAGDYYSDELRTVYSLQLREGKLSVRYPRGVLDLRPVNRDIFTSGFPMGTFVFQRNAAGACEGFAVTTGRVRNLKFARVRMAAGG